MQIKAKIDTFTNDEYADIIANLYGITIMSDGSIKNLINNGKIRSGSVGVMIDGMINNLHNKGTIEGSIYVNALNQNQNDSIYKGNGTLDRVINEGIITNGIYVPSDKVLKTTIIDNRGTINCMACYASQNRQNGAFGVGNLIGYQKDKTTFKLQNYALTIGQKADLFNNANADTLKTRATANYHLVVEKAKVEFLDNDSKIILDFGGDFEYGREYLRSKLIIDENGNTALEVKLRAKLQLVSLG